MKMMVVLMWLALAALPAAAQDWAKAKLEKSPRHGEWVEIKQGERTVRAFVVYPESKKKAPAVVVIHEIFGLTDWVRTVADELGANGYIAVAPDLLSGMGPNGGGSDSFADTDGRRAAIGKLDPNQVTADLNAAADYAKKLPASNGQLAVGGFCWGGGQTFRFTTDRKDLSAAFVFYGPPPKEFAGLGNITAPVYGFYGENDARINATIPGTEKAMKEAGKKYEPVTYAGAGHGFMRSGEDPKNPEPANTQARADAWKRWLALLKKM